MARRARRTQRNGRTRSATQRAQKTQTQTVQHNEGFLESEWNDFDRSLDSRIDDLSATAAVTEQLTAPESADDVAARQLAAFRANQEARGVVLQQADPQSDRDDSRSYPLGKYNDGPRR